MVAPGSWPWRRAALLLCIAAQLITIAALEGADPIPATWAALLLARRADIETTVLLLAIGAAVTEIAVRGRQHAAAARRAGYLDGINAAARAVATGESAVALTSQVCEQLTGLLRLSGCRFQDGVAGIGRPARLLRDGTVVSGAMVWDIERDGPPPGRDIELLAEAGGLLQGRFLLTPGPGTRPALEQRLVAVALADQAGAALSRGHPVNSS